MLLSVTQPPAISVKVSVTWNEAWVPGATIVVTDAQGRTQKVTANTRGEATVTISNPHERHCFSAHVSGTVLVPGKTGKEKMSGETCLAPVPSAVHVLVH